MAALFACYIGEVLWMYCRNCGSEINSHAAVCVQCGVPVGKGKNYCHNCGAQTHPEAVVCVRCGVGFDWDVAKESRHKGKSKIIAGLLGVFIGMFGVHNFYLGYKSRGIVQLVLSLASFVLMFVLPFVGAMLLAANGIVWGTLFIVLGTIVPTFTFVGMAIWGFVEGVLILSGKITDADGAPLDDDF